MFIWNDTFSEIESICINLMILDVIDKNLKIFSPFIKSSVSNIYKKMYIIWKLNCIYYHTCGCDVEINRNIKLGTGHRTDKDIINNYFWKNMFHPIIYQTFDKKTIFRMMCAFCCEKLRQQFKQ